MENINEVNEELDEFISQLTDASRTSGLTTDQFAKLGIILKKNTDWQTKLGKAVKSSTDGMNSFVQSAASGSASFESTSTAVTAVGNVMADLASGIPLVGGVMKGLASVTSFAIKRISVSYSAFKDLGEAGMLGAEGLDGLRAQMVQTGIPMERLSKMMVSASESVAYFSGSASKGADKFTEVLGSIQRGEDMRLRRLGFSIEEISETVINFQKSNRRLGFKQELSVNQLRNASARYGKELDLVAKLTGKQRKSIEKERDVLMADEQFRAMMGNLTNITEEAKRKMMDGLNQFAPGMRTGIKQIFASGTFKGDDAKRLAITGSLGKDILAMRAKWRTGQMTIEEVMQTIQKSAEKNKGIFARYTEIVGESIGVRHNELLDAATRRTLDAKEAKELRDIQATQLAGGNDLTEATITANNAMQRSQVKLDTLATQAGFAATAITSFSKVLDYGTDALMGILGTDKDSMKGADEENKERFGNMSSMSLSDTSELLSDMSDSASQKAKLIAFRERKHLDNTANKAELIAMNERIAIAKKRRDFLNGDSEEAKKENAVIAQKQKILKLQEKYAYAQQRRDAIEASYIDGSWYSANANAVASTTKREGSAKNKLTAGQEKLKGLQDNLDFAKIGNQSIKSTGTSSAKDIRGEYGSIRAQFKNYTANAKSDGVINATESKNMAMLETMLQQIASIADASEKLQGALISKTNEQIAVLKRMEKK